MKVVVTLKLAPTEAQRRTLLATIQRFNEAANWVAGMAFEHRTASKYRLQRLVYHEVRERFSLSAQMTVRCISKVAEAYKRNKSVKPVFREHGAVVYDGRIMSFKGDDRVSLLTVAGREILPIRLGDHQRRRLAGERGQSDLIYRNGTFYLAVAVSVPEPAPEEPAGTLGVDLGIVNLATDSDGEVHTGETLEKNRARYERMRRELQRVGTKSAKRHLKKLSGRESRFRRDTNHVISKKVVSKAKASGRAIALEDLEGIRARTGKRLRRSQRSRHGSWSYRQLRSFIEYKAKLAGVVVSPVDPRGTSTTCPACGHSEKANRTSRDRFRCKSCGHAAAADINAAINIAARAEAMRPIVSEPLSARGTSPPS